ncbi:GNAT family N-acetyltransferase [Streptomyces sp. NPDC051001]|uniref:GNAT family N-acetyltransferase n=1 Tax=Streptomyces sp. NPDC051001 TaxID=3155795 RepID=UPI00344ACA3C
MSASEKRAFENASASLSQTHSNDHATGTGRNHGPQHKTAGKATSSGPLSGSVTKGLAPRVHAVATLADHRRRGYANAALTAHLEGDRVTLYELHACDESAPLYAALGFTRDPALMPMTRIPSPAHVTAHRS